MASLDSVHQKLQRATVLREELEQELRTFYQSGNPVKLSLAGGTNLAGFNLGGEVPARMGLIAGDVLQCIRSSLDYLVYELADAYSGKPDRQNQFPITLTPSDYRNEVTKRKRLHGIDPAAAALIDLFQPYRLEEAERDNSKLAILDKLTNINKHRRVILTTLQQHVTGEKPLPFPQIVSTLVGTMPDGNKHTFASFHFYVAFNEGPIAGKEIGTSLDLLGNFVGYKMLPVFEQFFK